MMREAQKWSCAVWRAAMDRRSSSAGSLRMEMAPAAIPSTSPTSKSRPLACPPLGPSLLVPSSISSGTPPTRVAMAGTQQAMASSAARPKDSSSEGMSMRSERARSSLTFSCLPTKSTRSATPRRMARNSAAGRAGPSPIMSGRAGGGAAGEGLDDVEDALDRGEVGEMDEQAFAGLGEARALLGYQLRVADVEVAVDEVADDFDVAGDAEVDAGLVAEIGGDAGDAVGLGYSEFCDGEVGAVEAYQGDVGAVEGGDEGQMTASGGQHLAGQKGADGVGDCVVDVEEIEGVKLGYFGHAGGEG